MTYKLEQIEGIGPFFAERLVHAGVNNSDELLTRCSTDDGKRRLADSCAISVGQLTTWMHQADLMRVSGIGSEFGQLLEVSGVESVKQLSERDPESIAHLMHRVNNERKLTRAVPSTKTVAKWVSRAKEMVGVRAPSETVPSAGYSMDGRDSHAPDLPQRPFSGSA